MSAVIDGNVFSHEITQKEYNKFLAVNDMQRMKLFDKIFPEVKMCTKEGHGFNLGVAILAAVTTGLDVAACLSRPAMPRPDIYEHKGVYFKPGEYPQRKWQLPNLKISIMKRPCHVEKEGEWAYSPSPQNQVKVVLFINIICITSKQMPIPR